MPEEPESRLLQRYERDLLSKEIEQRGLDPSHFQWGKTDSTKTPNLKVLIVKNLYTGTSFIFDFDGDRHVTVTWPGPETRYAETWENQLGNFRKWLELVKDRSEKQRAADDAEVGLELEKAEERFLSYEGDSYLTDSWMGGGLTLEEAQAEVQDPRFLRLCREWTGLEYILKDRWATQALMKAILERHEGVLYSLYLYAERQNPFPSSMASKTNRATKATGRPGPKPDPETGKHKTQMALELQQQGLSLSEIAFQMYGDREKGNRVAALLSQRSKQRKYFRVTSQ